MRCEISVNCLRKLFEEKKKNNKIIQIIFMFTILRSRDKLNYKMKMSLKFKTIYSPKTGFQNEKTNINEIISYLHQIGNNVV